MESPQRELEDSYLTQRKLIHNLCFFFVFECHRFCDTEVLYFPMLTLKFHKRHEIEIN